MWTNQPGKIFREILDDDAVVRWNEPGQIEEGTFLEGQPAGPKGNILFTFSRPDGTTFKFWETYILKKRLAKVQPGDTVWIEYLGLDKQGKTKLFNVGVVETESL